MLSALPIDPASSFALVCTQAAAASGGGREALSGLCQLELAMLVAMHRLEETGKTTFNFEMVYDECARLRAEGQRHLWRRPACLRAYASVVAAGLAAFVDKKIEERAAALPFAATSLEVSRSETEAALRAHGTDQLRRWLANESVAAVGDLW